MKSFSLLAFIVAMLVGALQYSQLGIFYSFSQSFNDVNFAIDTKKINDDVVLVGIDEKSINRFGRWPWDRAVLAKGIKNLKSADAVAFDMVFSEEAPGDDALAEALLYDDNSVCGLFLRHQATQNPSELQLDILQNSSLDILQSKLQENIFVGANFVELNTDTIIEACTLNGIFSTLPAKDKIYRNYPIAFYYQDTLIPSLGVQALRLKLNSDLDLDGKGRIVLADRVIPLNKDGFLRLNFYHKEQYKTYSFLDLYEGKIKPEQLKGKIVLFGVTEMGIGDVVPTPIGNIYGVYLHYTFLSNFLNDEMIYENEWLHYIFTVLSVVFVLLYIWLIKNLTLRIVAYIGSYVLFYIGTKLLFVYFHIYIDSFYPLVAYILGIFSLEGMKFYQEEQDARFVKKAFSNYLSKELLDTLVHSPKGLELGGEEKELTILFSDIRSFTSLSEKMESPKALIQLLNRYFTPMTEAVLQNKGMLDKYIGDAVMAFFNAPVDVPNHAEAACNCALDMIEKLSQLNKELEAEGYEPIRIGIGINTGIAVVGNMGSNQRFNYTVIGDSVNLASRLESKTKEFGVDILISQYTYDRVKDKFHCKDLGFTHVKGKEEGVEVYQLLGRKE